MTSLISMTWIYTILVVAYAITIFSIVGVVLSENRNPLKSLAWVTVLLMFPVGGIILYIFFGRSIKNKRMISRRNRRRLLQSAMPQQHSDGLKTLSPELRQIVELGKNMADAPYLDGNKIDLYFNGTDKFEALLADIDAARSYINIQYYIISDDALGTRLKDALINKAQQGLKIRIIYDHIGSLSVKKKYFKELTAAGIEAYPFFRVAFPPFATRINWRNHRKLAVIDGQIGYIGGMNVAQRYIDGGKNFDSWRDTHLRIVGPAVAALQYSFAVDWSFMGHSLIEEPVYSTIQSPPGQCGTQLLTSGPTSEWTNIAMMMLKAIGNARHHIYIQTPYLLPTESLLRSLQAAALARVDVRIMIPLKSDSRILTYASRSFIMECLRSGIKIYLYHAGMLHSKTLIVDNELCSIGSANIDFRSFEHNFESTMFIYSRHINEQMQRQFILDQQNCHRINEAAWRARPMRHKALESLVRLLSPVL